MKRHLPMLFVACLSNLLGPSCSIGGISSLYLRTLDIHILCLSSYLLQQKRSGKLLPKTYRGFHGSKFQNFFNVGLLSSTAQNIPDPSCLTKRTLKSSFFSSQSVICLYNTCHHTKSHNSHQLVYFWAVVPKDYY